MPSDRGAGAEDNRPGVVRVARGAGHQVWFSGDVYSIKLTAHDTDGSLGFIHASVPPSGGPPLHYHARSDEFFYVLSGDVEFSEDDRIIPAGPGDLIYIRRGTHHKFHNKGTFAAELLFFYTPGGPELAFAEGGDTPIPGLSAPSWGPERFANEQMVALLQRYDQNILG